MIDILDVMKNLAEHRPVYHSEADFQHAFAWEVHRCKPSVEVRLEKPIFINKKKLHLDLLFQLSGKTMAVELKYKTRELGLNSKGEDFQLAGHGAQDFGRYDFIKDIQRLEDIASHINDCEGWAIFLTNDSSYWNPSCKESIDQKFRIDRRVLSGSLSWSDIPEKDPTKARKERKGREDEIELKGEYPLQWINYSTVNSEKHEQFRFLAVNVLRHV